MPTSLTALFTALSLTLCAPSSGQDSTGPQPETPVYQIGATQVDDASYPYILLTPPDDAQQPEAGWPLVVFLHGAGERGSDNQAQARHFPERMAGPEYRERFPCYLLALQCPADQRWAEYDWRTEDHQSQTENPSDPMQAVIQTVKTLVAERPIDLHRLYLTGLSMGGFGAWDLAARKHDWFAAVAPICGGGDPSLANAYKNLPIWAWHDRDDPVVPVNLTRRMVAAAEQAGAHIQYQEVTGSGHASWLPAYAADEVPQWLFNHTRDNLSEELLAARPPR